MPRITDVRETMPDGSALWSVRLEGDIEGQWVRELRRAWRAVRLAAAGASIRVVLANVQVIDAAGKAVLAEMERDGVAGVAPDDVAATRRYRSPRGGSRSTDG